MKKGLLFLFVCGVVLTLAASAFAQGKTVKLTSLEWPPYTSSGLSEQGANVAVAKAAFAAMGYTLEVDFYPWKRAVNLGKSSDEYVGYFPEYYAKEIESDFIFSDSLGNSPLGFAEFKSAPVSWNSLSDLKGVTIGTVQGYVNEAKFDEMAANGELTVDAVVDDLLNLRKLARGRLQLCVIDKNVLSYLLATDDSVSKHKGDIQFNSKLLDDKTLHICFQKNDKGQAMAKIFNEGLSKIDANKITEEYFSNNM